MNAIAKLAKHIATTVVLLSTLGLMACAQSVELSQAERDAAVSWLTLVDQGSYGQSWQSASSVFRSAVLQDDWVKQIRAARAPVGAHTARTQANAVRQQDPAGAPDGSYLTITYDSAFERKSNATETLSLYQEPDGSWRVAGYWIK